MSAADLSRLSAAHRRALDAYARRHGRTWRAKLLAARARGGYGIEGDLVHAVNLVGPSGIRAYKPVATRNPGRKAKARGTSRGTKTKDDTGRQEWSIKTKGQLGADWYSTKGAALRAAAQRVRLANKYRTARPGDFIEVRQVRSTFREYVANRQGMFVLKADYDKDRSTALSNEGYTRSVVRKNLRREKAQRKGARRAARKPAPSHRITSPRRRSYYDE